MAVALKEKQVKESFWLDLRLKLENLGFLPGDMKEKLDTAYTAFVWCTTETCCLMKS
jgi:hypothetical protein